MTWQQLDAELRAQIEALENQAVINDIMVVVASHVAPFQIARIFNDGEDSSGNQIGNYSITSPKFATIESFVVRGAFRPNLRIRRVSRGSRPGAAGTPRTSITLWGGYAQLRAMQGFKTDKVNLDYSGSLRLSLQVGTRGNAVVFGNTSRKQGEIATNLERKYSKAIFSLSQDELEEAENAMVQAVNQILS